MGGCEVEVKVKKVRPSRYYSSGGDISAVIGIMGEGMVYFSFPLELASVIVGKLVGRSPDSKEKFEQLIIEQACQ